jgi:hypothetical protein
MSIQFNKVTWYSKLAAVIVLLATMVFGWYIGQQYVAVSLLGASVVSSGVATSSQGDIALPVGQVGTINGVQVFFKGVEQDNRCPVDVRCIQAGAVTLRLALGVDGVIQQINFSSNQAPYQLGHSLISIVRISPQRYSQTQIDPSVYIVVFHVTQSAL